MFVIQYNTYIMTTKISHSQPAKLFLRCRHVIYVLLNLIYLYNPNKFRFHTILPKKTKAISQNLNIYKISHSTNNLSVPHLKYNFNLF